MESNVMNVEHPCDVFGVNVFNLSVMRERLPKNVFKVLKKTIDLGETLDPSIADVVANAMKDWAIEKGATHFSHWFQPMTGLTAEKHDSFISPTSDGRIIMEFSGKNLIQGEPDASSFPSGGLRATFEARGYTAWDCTSPVFVKKDGANITMFIPCAFCSYTGEALDKKTPLLRSMEAVNKQAMRVLRAFGNATSQRVNATVGAEQEYFLVDKKFYESRLDLIAAGRTLFGAPPAKGQEKDDHYFGAIQERVASFMAELNMELWALGVSATTQHNEVSPAQYELAPIFGSVNVATDQNQLTMNAMEKVARRHDFVCLMHEKPFAGVNGSGKHNNWSLATDDGFNLLDPGRTPHDNAQFLVFLCAVIAAVDKHAGLLRASVASAGNDHRLGANEAPPAIISIFLGEQLADIMEQLEKGDAKSSKKGGELKLGVSTLPDLPRDCTDRNRTSPFAFTGNKFEFRMVGSAMSIAGANFVLNSIVADELEAVADLLEKGKDVNAVAQKYCQAVAKENKKVIFNGNNYADEWVVEAEKRGLPNLKNTVDALDMVVAKETKAVFKRQKVLSAQELDARHEILLENYITTINIEARTMLEMGGRQILPVSMEYAGQLAAAVATFQDLDIEPIAQKEALGEVQEQINAMKAGLAVLKKAADAVEDADTTKKQAVVCRDKVIPAMLVVREAADALEMMVDAELWPLPTYLEMLFLR